MSSGSGYNLNTTRIKYGFNWMRNVRQLQVQRLGQRELKPSALVISKQSNGPFYATYGGKITIPWLSNTRARKQAHEGRQSEYSSSWKAHVEDSLAAE